LLNEPSPLLDPLGATQISAAHPRELRARTTNGFMVSIYKKHYIGPSIDACKAAGSLVYVFKTKIMQTFLAVLPLRSTMWSFV
jgi:hypothetical protein